MNNTLEMSSLNEVNHVEMLPRGEVDISRGKLLSLYKMKGWTVKQIANYFNCDIGAVSKHINAVGLNGRTKEKINVILSKSCAKGHIIKLVENKYKGDHKKQIYKCDCGKTHYINWITIRGSIYYYGGIFVCHTLIPYGEFLVEKFLKDTEYNYKKQYSFEDLVDKSKLLFDFAVFKNQRLLFLIEHDGKYHNSGEELTRLHNNLSHDKMKNQYCKEKDIPLLRINNYKRIPEQIESFVGKLS